jgi:hypothetical protein
MFKPLLLYFLPYAVCRTPCALCALFIIIIPLSLIMRELLLLLSHYPFDELNRETLSDLLAEVKDWPKLAELINAHGIIALAAYNIKEAGLEKKIPPEAMAILENGYLQSVVRNTWLTQHWKEVNTILCNAEIKHVLLKGMALEHTLYGSRGLRQMNDNDILIKKEDCMKAWSLLQQYGFSPGKIKSPLYKNILPHIGKHLPELHKDGYVVEIHHKLFDNQIESGSAVLDPVDASVEINIGDTKAFILSPEMQMKHLISHFERHALEGSVQIRQYADIFLLNKNTDVVMPEKFIADPHQSDKSAYRKAAYKRGFRTVPVKYRLRYLAGDIFPSLSWMKERYRCSGMKALLFYPHRIGKLLWLIT